MQSNPNPPRNIRKKVQILTTKLIPAMIKLYQMDDEFCKKSAIDLASATIESYSDYNEMKKDIFGCFVSDNNMLISMQLNMERRYPEETNILKEIFGISLFGR